MSLIHIGLHKTGPTALQEAWSSADNINLNWKNLASLIEEIRQNVKNDDISSTDNDVQRIQLTSQNDSKVQIYSSEALSTYIYGIQCSRKQVTLSRQLAAYYMQQIAPDSHVLIVCREPVSWITSIYKQYVQEGGYRSLQNFLLAESDFLAQSLSIRELVQIWEHFFDKDRIIILPYEMLRKEPERFFAELADKTNISYLANSQLLEQVNVSLTEQELEFMLQANRWLKLLSNNVDLTALTMQKLAKELNQSLRLELQRKNKLSKVINRLALEQDRIVQLPDVVMKSLVEDNLLFLKSEFDTFYGYLTEYTS